MRHKPSNMDSSRNMGCVKFFQHMYVDDLILSLEVIGSVEKW